MNNVDDLRVSIVIPHFQMPRELRRCLASVLAQRLDHGRFEVIVVDNASRDFPSDVANDFENVTFVRESTPGPGIARNTGAAAATAPILLFIDADCVAYPGWAQAAVDAVAVDIAHRIVGGDVRVDLAEPGAITALEAYESVFAYRQRSYIESQHFSGTGNLAVGRAVYDAVGPFAGIDVAEDREWGQRASALGFRVVYEPKMVISHPARTSFDELQRKWQRHIAHDLFTHRAAGKSDWRWRAQAAIVLASIPVHVVKLFVSDRISGSGGRIAGAGILVRIRLWRIREMLAAARGRMNSASVYWTGSQ